VLYPYYLQLGGFMDLNVSHLNKLDRDYVLLIKKIFNEGVLCENRTGIDTIAISGHMIEHDMASGFPLLTIKKTMFDAMAVELEGFIKGITDKKWYIDRGCKIWNEWCSPKALKRYRTYFPNDTHTDKEIQLELTDLGKIYGSQWNNFGGVNQLNEVVNTLRTNPNSRRMIVSAWNPPELDNMALPPCHVLWQLNKIGERVDLVWYQRSVDTFLGLPFNIASYSLLLSLICHVTGNVPGKVIGMLSNVHIYKNQIDPINEKLIPTVQLEVSYDLPTIKISKDLTNLHEFDASKHVKLVDYKSHPFIKAEVAV